MMPARFYKIYPEKGWMLFRQYSRTISCFWSIAITTGPKLLEFIIRQTGKNIVIDPIRNSTHRCKLKPLILENLSYADIVRGSNEDFSFILGADDADEAYAEIGKLSPNLLFTANKKGVYVRTPTIKLTLPVKTIDPVSTIGAGDN
jgi:fructokinase